ncbi:DVU_1553 family AMP-dependent CoA ligase [Fundidesulfovibrio agrisoli]|uniref:DVU_1553 family AMP-dependent CoA ligase n=1 Tax=Fundidesulfovibrio agrisoli TaxID=2922717 RepID=UPI001FAC482A|nr:AMP-binding protein [Fundidesulfovibrio agrisoli]
MIFAPSRPAMRSPLDAWVSLATGLHGPEPDALRRWQALRLLEAARWARERSPFYARLLKHLPDPIPDDPAWAARLPFVTTHDLREHHEAMLCVSQGEVERVVTLNTSGTTGKPKRLFFTGEDLDATLDFFRVGMASFTGVGDVVLILLPGRTEHGAAMLLAKALAEIGVRPVLAPQPCPPEVAARLIAEEGVTCLAALPSQLRALLEHSPGPPPWSPAPDRALDRALLSGEPVDDGLRQAAAKAGIEIFAHYGLTETCFGGGVECGAHQGYHLREADLLVEVVEPVSGDPVANGRQGEVVLSTLNRRGMPLLRYRTGDMGRMLPGPCACGSPLRRLGPVAGRIVTDGGAIQVLTPEKGTANTP